MVKLTNSQAWWVIDEKIEVGHTKLQSTLALSYKNLDDAIAGNVEPLQKSEYSFRVWYVPGQETKNFDDKYKLLVESLNVACE